MYHFCNFSLSMKLFLKKNFYLEKKKIHSLSSITFSSIFKWVTSPDTGCPHRNSDIIFKSSFFSCPCFNQPHVMVILLQNYFLNLCISFPLTAFIKMKANFSHLKHDNACGWLFHLDYYRMIMILTLDPHNSFSNHASSSLT